MKWINLSIRVFSPREFLCGLFGIVTVLAAMAGKVHPVIAVFGIVILVFGFIPFGFLSPEKQLISFFAFHTKKDNSIKKSKKAESENIGIGVFAPEMTLDDDDIQKDKQTTVTRKTADGVETVLVEDLDMPYTLKLKTSAKKQFIPVLIFFSEPSSSQQHDEIHVASTTTGRNGKVFCTILLEGYGKRRVRVISDDDDDDERKIFYDKTVVFQRK